MVGRRPFGVWLHERARQCGQLDDPATLRFEVIYALGIGALFTLRLMWTKAYAGTTRLPSVARAWEHRASRVVHLALYASVFGIVLSGLAIAVGYSIPFLNGIFLAASLWLHEVFLTALPAFLIVNVAGVLWHRIVRRDGVLESMVGKTSGFASVLRG